MEYDEDKKNLIELSVMDKKNGLKKNGLNGHINGHKNGHKKEHRHSSSYDYHRNSIYSENDETEQNERGVSPYPDTEDDGIQIVTKKFTDSLHGYDHDPEVIIHD